MPITHQTPQPVPTSSKEYNSLLERLLAAILLAIAAQTLNVLLWSSWQGLAESWIGSLIIALTFISYSTVTWRRATLVERQELRAPWLGFLPWLILGLLILQIIFFDPTMNDSLSYRLPRIFTWLQDGQIHRVHTADSRINCMPFGWEALAIPFASLNILNAARMSNVVMWLLLYQILCHWTRVGGASQATARWLALGMASALGFLIQASSSANDFFALGLLLIGTHGLLMDSQRPQRYGIVFPLLALVLASNVKPQFLVLGMGWGLWWLFSPQQLYKHTPWKVMIPAIPLLILVSPLPLLWDNLQVSHLLMGEATSALSANHASAPLKALAGAILFAVSQLQLPLMPCVGTLNAALSQVPGFADIHQLIPKFTPGVSPMAMIDNSSFGLVHGIIFTIGILLAWRRYRPTRWLCLTAGVGFLLAASQVSVGSIGRSFMGFGALLMPAIAVGLAQLHRRKSWVLASLAILTGLTTLIFNPSHPLWPSRSLESQASRHGWNKLCGNLKTYNSYRLRADTGKGILDAVPSGEPVAALFRSVTPLANLWVPDWRKHKIEFIQNRDPQKLNQGAFRWLVMGDKAIEQFPEMVSMITSSPDWEKVTQRTYLPNIQQGTETWTLYCKKSH
ncbi:MAG: hypothetical protein WCL19_09930 [Verrucomicrobiota bacterium]